ncbi:MAG: hypothetical protein PUD59_01430 [bacterium]|nr:hypothetical protein [bacterium]
MTRLFFFLLGFGLSIIGFMYVVLYLNLIPIGYTFVEYLDFIIKRPECILGFIGFMILNVTIFYKEKF